MATLARPVVESFHGLNNVADPLKLDASWASIADNVTITDRGELVRAEGFTKVATGTAIVGAYTTKDLQRFYTIDAGELRELFDPLNLSNYRVLQSGLSLAPYHFQEVNGIVYYANGIDRGAIEPDGWRPWGIPTPTTPNVAAGNGNLNAGLYRVFCTFVDDRGMESGNSGVAAIALSASSAIQITAIEQRSGYTTNVYVTPSNGANDFLLLAEGAGESASYNAGQNSLGREFDQRFWFTDLPRGTIPALFEGQMYSSEWFPDLDQTAIWRSLPLAFHHFNPSSEGIAVPGQVQILRATSETLFAGTERLTQRGVAEALIIGTDRAIFSWSDNQLVTLAHFGVVPGWHAFEIKGKLYFWTLRGLCRALPFENLTEAEISVAPGVSAGGMVVERGGFKRYVVALQAGGEAFNARSQ